MRAKFAAAITPGASSPLAAASLWPVSAVAFSALLISWAAEVAEFFISRGLALAVLAFLQVSPEFAVEAAIANNAAGCIGQKGLEECHGAVELVTANFTGANRLLVGFIWPVIFFLAAASSRRRGLPFRQIALEREHSVEGLFLLLPSLYFIAIYLRGSITLLDTAVLASLYGAYLWVLGRMPPEAGEAAAEVPGVAGRVLRGSRRTQKLFVAGGFLAGGLMLSLAAEPFLQSMMGLAALFGISAFFFVQWIAPALSEFPEFLAASRWAARVRTAHVALGNIIAAQISQWTLLVAMIPVVFSLTLGRPGAIALGELQGVQRVEILLTVAQSLAAVAILLKMRVTASDAGALFALWLFQFVEPGLREEMVPVYLAFAAYQVVRHRKEIRLFSDFRHALKAHVFRGD